mgnify:CR=1 FL=1
MPEGMKESAATPMEGVESTSKSKTATVEDDVPEPARAKPAPAAAPKQPEPEPEPQVEPDAEEKQKAVAAKARGAEAYKQRDFETAVKAFEEAWETWPKDVTFLTNLAGTFGMVGAYR